MEECQLARILEAVLPAEYDGLHRVVFLDDGPPPELPEGFVDLGLLTGGYRAFYYLEEEHPPSVVVVWAYRAYYQVLVKYCCTLKIRLTN
ncbi:hypothetical protein QE152_g1141 [Popillia japonica]|uniref:Uncharacterized protein n=1 Tax=Popillia japonica TaxID=7064 RepID=A0AAW1N6K7_POPJA